MHGLPLTYNKDMQEDKEPLFDASDTLELSLRRAPGCSSTITFRRERLAAAAADEFLAATDVADLLVRRGLPFREAHGVVAGLVRRASSRASSLSELSRPNWRPLRAARRRVLRACCATERGSSRRCPTAAPPAAGARTAAGAGPLGAAVRRAFYARPVLGSPAP